MSIFDVNPVSYPRRGFFRKLAELLDGFMSCPIPEPPIQLPLECCGKLANDCACKEEDEEAARRIAFAKWLRGGGSYNVSSSLDCNECGLNPSVEGHADDCSGGK